MKIFKKILIVLVLMLCSFASVAPVWAEPSNVCEDPKIKNDPQLAQMAGCTDTKRADEVINNVMPVVFGAMGVLAVGVMIFGGIMYAISVGDAQKAYRARHIIMYGLIGFIVSLLAYAIVKFISVSLAGAAV